MRWTAAVNDGADLFPYPFQFLQQSLNLLMAHVNLVVAANWTTHG
jgi:hypothetical protein